jgi:hypothetical protein
MTNLLSMWRKPRQATADSHCVIPRRAKALAWIHNPRSSVVVVGPLAGTIKDWTSIAFTITERLARPVVKLVDEEKEAK